MHVLRNNFISVSLALIWYNIIVVCSTFCFLSLSGTLPPYSCFHQDGCLIHGYIYFDFYSTFSQLHATLLCYNFNFTDFASKVNYSFLSRC